MPKVLNKADIVCLPSSCWKGVPKALLEVMACGKPCITTDTPGCRDCVADGDNGLLTPVRDDAVLAEAIRWLITHEEERRRMGAESRRIAETRFDQQIILGNI